MEFVYYDRSTIARYSPHLARTWKHLKFPENSLVAIIKDWMLFHYIFLSKHIFCKSNKLKLGHFILSTIFLYSSHLART